MAGSRIVRFCGAEIWGKACGLAKGEPKKVVHCFKAGMAVSMVSLFYYMNPLYEGVGESVMWAILTVIVVFEYTVGATIGKCLNRMLGGAFGGALGLGVHSMATRLGDKFQPILLQASVFLLVSSLTFLRFIPVIKAHLDHGAAILMITFTMVSVSGYRVDELRDLASDRVITTALGCFICILTNVLVYPTWAGDEIHGTVKRKMKSLSDSLDACIEGCSANPGEATPSPSSEKKHLNYEDFLHSRVTEESLANFGRWEPTHGSFRFGHPWQGYLKIGDLIRGCAASVDQLNRTLDIQTPETSPTKDHLIKICKNLCSASSAVLKELVQVMHTMTKSSNILVVIEEATDSANELRSTLRSLSQQTIQVTILEHRKVFHSGDGQEGKEENASNISILPAVEILPTVQVCFLLIEITERTLKIAEAVDELGGKAKFRVEQLEKPKENKVLPQKEEEKHRVTVADALQNV